MADIRIKDLPTTASLTSSDDFIAIDGFTNGTRKLSAATPAFLTSVTTPSLTAPAATDLTLAGGSSGASLVLGQGANGAATITPAGSGFLTIKGGSDALNALWVTTPTFTALSAGSLLRTQFGATSGSTSVALQALTAGGLTTGGSLSFASNGDVTAQAGSSGASLVLGQGASGGVTTLRDMSVGTATLNIGASGGTVRAFNVMAPTGGYATIQAGSDVTADTSLLGGFGWFSTGSSTKTAAAINVILNGSAAGVRPAAHMQIYTESGSGLSERVRLTSTGNLLIGTTTDMSGSAGLKVASTSASTGSTSGAIITPGGIYAGAASVLASTVTMGGATGAIKTSAANNWGGLIGYSDAAVTQTWRALYDATSFLIGTSVATPLALQVNNTTALTLAPTTLAATFAGAVTAGGSVLVTGASKNIRIRDTGITDANYDTLLFQAYDQNVFSIGVGALAGTPSQIRINGATNAVAFTGAVSGITTLAWTGGTTATSTGNHVFGTTNTVVMSAGTLTTTGAATFGGAVSVSGTAATWTSGTGSPESAKTAPVGSLYTRTDGGASTTLYVKESGAGNTGWIAK